MRKCYWVQKNTIFRPRRTLQLMQTLISRFASIPPEVRYLPDNISYGSREHANFLFLCAFFSAHGVKTADVIFTLSELTSSTEGLVMIDPLGGDTFDWAVHWGLVSWKDRKRMDWLVSNMHRLADEYQGDPRQIFAATSPKRIALLEKIRSFDGFGLKVASLLIVFFQGTFWHYDPSSPISEELHAELLKIRAFPPDIHSMRMFGQSDLIKSCRRDHHHSLGEAIANMMEEVATRYSLSTRVLSQASFDLGSRICRNKPSDSIEQARYCRAHCCLECFCLYQVKATEYSKTGRLRYDKRTKRRRLKDETAEIPQDQSGDTGENSAEISDLSSDH